MLTVAIGSLQLMLDRGGEVEWFASKEIWLECGLAITGFWVFGVHILSSKTPFIDPRIFSDRNFVTGLFFLFVIGIILLASLALLPPMLSAIFGYPTLTTGIVMAPRGIGTMVSMLIVGRLLQKIDARLLVVAGLLLTTISLDVMTGFTPQMDSTLIVQSGVIQGLGLVFVPLSTIAFATLDKELRADATSLFSHLRNIGSSIGISVVSLMLMCNLQINHSALGASINPFNPVLRGLAGSTMDATPGMLMQIDGLVNQQALMIAYVDDLKLMMIVTIRAIPLAVPLRRPKPADAILTVPTRQAERSRIWKTGFSAKKTH